MSASVSLALFLEEELLEVDHSLAVKFCHKRSRADEPRRALCNLASVTGEYTLILSPEPTDAGKPDSEEEDVERLCVCHEKI